MTAPTETRTVLDEIKARADAATKGPWRPVDLRRQPGGKTRIYGGTGYDSLIADVLASGPAPAADAEFIARAREDVPVLVAEVERLTRALERVRDITGAMLRDEA